MGEKEAEKDYTLLHDDVRHFLQEENGRGSERAKPILYQVMRMYDFGLPLHEMVATLGRISEEIAEAMLSEEMVHRVHAEQVLAGLSAVTGVTWTLDNVKIALLPTFKDFHALYQFDLTLLSITSGVSRDTIDRMLCNEPVPRSEAGLVLQAASEQTGQAYTFSNVDVQFTIG